VVRSLAKKDRVSKSWRSMVFSRRLTCAVRPSMTPNVESSVQVGDPPGPGLVDEHPGRPEPDGRDSRLRRADPADVDGDLPAHSDVVRFHDHDPAGICRGRDRDLLTVPG
jgi:hypothetical protein